MSLLFPGVVVATALIYFFVTPDFARNRHILSRAFFAAAAAAGSFLLLYFIQLPFTDFNLLFWFLINVAGIDHDDQSRRRRLRRRAE